LKIIHFSEFNPNFKKFKQIFDYEINPNQSCNFGEGTFSELAKERKIMYHEYDVETEDNFVLKVFRIF